MTEKFPQDDEEFRAGIFYGQKPPLQGTIYPPGRPMRQLPQTAIDQIKQLVKDSMLESLPPAMEEGAERIAKTNEGTITLMEIALGITALSTATIAVLMLLDRA